MLTNLTIGNFKWFEAAEIELGQSVLLIGPNNSGKTTALQALALWDVGLRLWNAKRGGKTSPEKRPGVTINRRDLVPIPIPTADLLWRDLHVREGERLGAVKGGRLNLAQRTFESTSQCQEYQNPESGLADWNLTTPMKNHLFAVHYDLPGMKMYQSRRQSSPKSRMLRQKSKWRICHLCPDYQIANLSSSRVRSDF